MSDWAQIGHIIFDTSFIAEGSRWAWYTISGLSFALIEIVGTDPAGSRLIGLLRADVTLGTNPRHTVIFNAVSSFRTRFAEGFVSGTCGSIVETWGTSHRHGRRIKTVMPDFTDLTRVSCGDGSEIAEVTSVTVSLDETGVAILSNGAGNTLFLRGQLDHSRVGEVTIWAQQRCRRFRRAVTVLTDDGVRRLSWAIVTSGTVLALSRSRSSLVSSSCARSWCSRALRTIVSYWAFVSHNAVFWVRSS